MIGIYLNDNSFEQDIRELLMAFYPGETFCHEPQEGVRLAVTGVLSEDRTQYELALWELTDEGPESLGAIRSGEEEYPGFRRVRLSGVRVPTENEAERRELSQIGEPVSVDFSDHTDTKNKIKRRLYVMLRAATGKTMPWGSLTGIRPTKIAMTRLSEGWNVPEISSFMKENYFSSDEKTALAVEIAQRERGLLAPLDVSGGYSLYVGIPFCPTTCLYCSFTSYPIEKWRGKTQLYLDALFRELDYVAEKRRGSVLDTVYFGGGTPTSLSAEDLERLLSKVRETFDWRTVKEFTVEAGRPDSITAENLQVLKRYGVTRISINPQTMNQRTLDLIGRRHTVEEVKEKFALARAEGFANINMDLICGLPEEELSDVRATMEQVKALAPDSVTVHSLAIKRAARLNTMKEVYKDLKITNTQEMIDLTAEYTRGMGLLPYYLYRQKNMAGNFENVGYAAHGKACIYNILIMEEQQTIIGCGAGTTTKRVIPGENRIERCENVKNVEQYIARIDEMIERKKTLFEEN